MKCAYYIQCFAAPKQLELVVDTLDAADAAWRESFEEVVVVDCSTNPGEIREYGVICESLGFRHLTSGKNYGISGGRVVAARDFLKGECDVMVTQGDGMLWQGEGAGVCRYGFARHSAGFFKKAVGTLVERGLDYLKLTWCEKYGTNAHFYSYHALRGDEKRVFFPAVFSGTPSTVIRSIHCENVLPVAVGDFPYSNWPAVWSRRFAEKFIGSNKISTADEQSWMRQLFRDSLDGGRAWRVGCLLMTPVEYEHRFDYKRSLRREN